MKRRYPQDILIEAFNKSWNKSQADLLIPKVKLKDNKIRLVTTFNQRNPPMKNILKKYDSWLDKTKKDIKPNGHSNCVQESQKSEAITSERKKSQLHPICWDTQQTVINHV